METQLHKRRYGLRQILVATALLSTGCEPGSQRSDQRAEDLIRLSIYESIRGTQPTDIQVGLSTGFPDSIQFRSDSSRVINGLRYVRGTFIPLNLHDVKFEDVALEYNGRARLADGLASWMALADAAQWEPANSTAASRACEEIVTYLVPSQTPRWPPIIYSEAAQVPWEDLIIREAQRSRIVSRAHAPRARLENGEWIATVWTVSALGSYAYECRIGGSVQRRRFNVAVVDSVD